MLGERSFDVAAEFLAFTPEHIRTDFDLFEGRVGQYVFISSASAYQTPPARLPVTESTPLRNPFWQYSRDKIACEDLLVEAYRERGFPMTIVRPSHTYDRTMIPTSGGWTDLDRMRRGAPVIVHGDGSSLWTITHNTDFAVAFVGLLGRPEAVGESFHITSDEAPTWDQIYRYLAEGLGVEADLVHVVLGIDRRRRPGARPRAGRRQGALDGVRQQQGEGAGAASSRRASRSPTERARSSTGSSPTRRGSTSTATWMRRSTTWPTAPARSAAASELRLRS